MQNKTFHIKTFGCQMNVRDSEIMAQKLAERGYVQTGEIDRARLIILNTCSVRGKAEQKVFSLLGSLRKRKQRDPGLTICVAGCVAQQQGELILERMSHVDFVVGTQHIYDIAGLIEGSAGCRTALHLSDNYEIPPYAPRFDTPPETTGPSASTTPFQYSRFVTIMQGCDNFCTYCVVPYTRGREVSRRAADILAEVAALTAAGVSEITLLGQNVNSYGSTNPVSADGRPYPFHRLLTAVAEIPGLRRLRFTTSHPKDLSAGLIDCFADLDVLCPQIHLPVQSGSEAILKLMQRTYRVADYLDKVGRLIDACPGIAITTDIIVGFPGETEEDFQQTMELLETVRFHGSFSFKYSDRPGTGAAGLDGKVSEAEKSRRLRVFQARQDEISLARNREYIGTRQVVLVERVEERTLVGRSPTNHVVHADRAGRQANRGDYVEAMITGAGQHSLKATLIPP